MNLIHEFRKKEVKIHVTDIWPRTVNNLRTLLPILTTLDPSEHPLPLDMRPPYPLTPEHDSKTEGSNTVYHYKDNCMTLDDLAFFDKNLALPANLESEQAVSPDVPWTPVLRTHNINVDKRKAPGEAITAIRGVSKLKNVNPDVFYKHLTTPELMKGWMGNLIMAKVSAGSGDWIGEGEIPKLCRVSQANKRSRAHAHTRTLPIILPRSFPLVPILTCNLVPSPRPMTPSSPLTSTPVSSPTAMHFPPVAST